MSTLTITTDQPSYPAGSIIHVTLSTDGPMTDTIIVTGQTEQADGIELSAVTTTVITGRYGPVTAPGYVVTQDPANPALFTLTPGS